MKYFAWFCFTHRLHQNKTKEKTQFFFLCLNQSFTSWFRFSVWFLGELGWKRPHSSSSIKHPSAFSIWKYFNFNVICRRFSARSRGIRLYKQGRWKFNTIHINVQLLLELQEGSVYVQYCNTTKWALKQMDNNVSNVYSSYWLFMLSEGKVFMELT